MAGTIPTAKGDTLVWRDGEVERSVTVGTLAWYAWLATASSFSFSGHRGNFVARKERFQRGGWYWKAYRKREGKLHRAYLGKTETLTPERLDEIAAALSSRSDSTGILPPDLGSTGSQRPSPKAVIGKAQRRTWQSFDRSPEAVPQVSLLLTKLSPPRLRSDVVARPHLSQRLNEALQRKLTLIAAPAGFGKTTLLSQWKQQIAYPTVWLSLDAGDNDPIQFWANVIASLQTLYPGICNHAHALLRSSGRAPVESFLTALINELMAGSDEFVLVLDDYHHIESQSVHGAMAFLLDHLPPRIHIVLSSRVEPPLPLARLRAEGQVEELRTADLSFTSEETDSFLKDVMGLGLSTEDVAALRMSTEGWIAGLQLAALSLKDCKDVPSFIKDFAGHHRYILDYLLEEVLRQQPDNVRKFLLQTSILDRLSSSLCESVTGQENGQAMLEWLERANLFITPLDNERRWYRYHGLFADSLRTCLHLAQPGEVSELHRRASVWYAKQGLAIEAVGHALAAGESEMIADLIEKTAPLILGRNEYLTIMEWARALPDNLFWSRPNLCIQYGWALLNTNQLEAAEAWLQDVEGHLGLSTEGAGGTPTEQSPDSVDNARRILGDIFVLRATMACRRQNVPLALTLCYQALDHLPKDASTARCAALRVLAAALRQGGDVEEAGKVLAAASAISQAIGDLPRSVLNLHELGQIRAIQGQLHQSAKLNRQALDLAEAHGVNFFPAASLPCISLALAYYEWDDRNAAICYALQGIELARKGARMDMLLHGYGVLARLKQAEGDFEGAFVIVEQAEQLARSTNYKQHVIRLNAYKVRLWLRQGKLEAATGGAEGLGLRVDDEINYNREPDYMVLAHVRIAQGRPVEAVVLLERLLKMAEEANRTGSVIKILALLATALQSQGNSDGALTALRRALSLAQPEGYVRSFVDLDAPMARMLETVRDWLEKGNSNPAKDMLASYVSRLLAAFGSQESPEPFEAGSHIFGEGLTRSRRQGFIESLQCMIEHLSERELDVLRLIAKGASNREIALELVVAESTVKKHINNIYGKLEVRSRIQAVERAKSLGVAT